MFKKSVVFVFWFMFFGTVLAQDNQAYVDRLVHTKQFTAAAFVGNNKHVWASNGIDLDGEDIDNLFRIFHPKLVLSGNVYFSEGTTPNGLTYFGKNVMDEGGIICYRTFQGILLGIYKHPVGRADAEQIMQEVAMPLLDN